MKRNGRPKGAIDPVLQPKDFGLDQFAAVKAFLLGIDPLVATKRYLLTDDAPQSSEAAIRQIGKLMLRIAARGHSRSHGDDEDESARNVSSAAALTAIANECLAATKSLAKLRTDMRKAKAEKHRAIAEAQGLRIVKKSQLPPLPERFQTLRNFDDWYEDTYMQETLLDDVELKSQYEDHLYAWYANQGIYYAPDYSSSISSSSEVAKVRATDLDQVPAVVYCNEGTRRAAAAVIDNLKWTVQRVPTAGDHISAWIGGTTLEALKSADVFTLYTLCDLIRKRGARWWTAVPSLGPVRAARIHDWIKEIGVQGVYFGDGFFEPIQRRRLREILRNERERPALPSLTKVMLEPLGPYVDNAYLNGGKGMFRSTTPNMLKAETDIDALCEALLKYEHKPATLKVYSREVCRFCLWSYKEMQLPISSIGVAEARRYREFLDKIPSDWISASPSPPPRNTMEWKPFRGQLDEASKRKALTSINVIFGLLHELGYLTGNPMSGVLKHSGFAIPKMDTSRSLSLDQWDFACRVLDAEIETKASKSTGPFGEDAGHPLRRLKAILHLLFATGLRRNELFNARLAHVSRIVVDGQATFLLEVMGKRSKIREVPIEPEVMQLVMAHVADRSPDFKDNLKTKGGRALVPLISVLRRPVKTYKRELLLDPHPIASANDLLMDGELEDEPSSLEPEAVKVEPGIEMGEQTLAHMHGALSPDAMLISIRRFFNKCAAAAPDHGVDKSAFEDATLHWMRHTFGHSMVDANVDMRVVQKAMGHVNINTTAIYSKADRDQMVRGLRDGSRSMQRATIGRDASALQVEVESQPISTSDGPNAIDLPE